MCKIWRLHIKTSSARGVDPHRFCREKGILGVGWPVDTDRESLNRDEYRMLGENRYGDKGWRTAVRAIQDRMKVNDLCWIRDSDSIYYLGQIRSEWSYQNTSEYRMADVVNIRNCMWQRVDLDAVPGKIISCFILGHALQEIHDDKAGMYSRYLWNKITGREVYEVNTEGWDIFMMLDHEETEDLIFLYLQSEGWYVVPNSRKGNTMKYEFYVVNPQTGERGVTQVKTGEEVLNREEFSPPSNTKVFLFQSNGLYDGETDENIICISREELSEFLNRAIPRNWLPGWLQKKWEMVNRSDT